MNCLYCKHKFECAMSRYNSWDVTQSSTVLCALYEEVEELKELNSYCRENVKSEDLSK